MVYSNFPPLGFPNETCERHGEVVYRARIGDCRIVVWEYSKKLRDYGVNLYHDWRTDGIPTHPKDRYVYNQEPIHVADAFEAQLAIFYLIQKHLPPEVIEAASLPTQQGDINGIHPAESAAPSQHQTGSMRADSASGEIVE
jgi:hypothetical protein